MSQSPAEQYQAAAAAVMRMAAVVEEAQGLVLDAVRVLGADPLGLMETSGAKDTNARTRRTHGGLTAAARVHAMLASNHLRQWTAKQLTEVLPDPQSTISSALSRLAAAGLVARERRTGGAAEYRWKRTPTKSELEPHGGAISEPYLRDMKALLVGEQ